jgi:hypothetical protein
LCEQFRVCAQSVEAAGDQVFRRQGAPAGGEQAGTESTYPCADEHGGKEQRQVRKSVERPLQGKGGGYRNDGHDQGYEVCARSGDNEKIGCA